MAFIHFVSSIAHAPHMWNTLDGWQEEGQDAHHRHLNVSFTVHICLHAQCSLCLSAGQHAADDPSFPVTLVPSCFSFYSPHFYGHRLLRWHLLQTRCVVLLRPISFVLQISCSLKVCVHATLFCCLALVYSVFAKYGVSLTNDTSCSTSLEHRVLGVDVISGYVATTQHLS